MCEAERGDLHSEEAMTMASRSHLQSVDSSLRTATVHQLKVTLRQVRPPVWRRILVDSSWTLSKLSGALEAAMGWYGGHLHAFDSDGVTYGQPDPDWDVRDERKVRVGEVIPDVGSKMHWDYDFGDGWEHDVVVEAIADRDPALSALRRRGHPRHEEIAEWMPPGFDPAHFDAPEINLVLKGS
jgi:hypothetical protein